MKYSIKVCVHRKSSEWKESSESRKSRIVVSSPRNLDFKIGDPYQYLYGHERQ